MLKLEHGAPFLEFGHTFLQRTLLTNLSDLLQEYVGAATHSSTSIHSPSSQSQSTQHGPSESPLISSGIHPGPSGILPGPLGILPGPSGILPGPLGILPGPSGILPGPSGILHGPSGIVDRGNFPIPQIPLES